MRRTLCNWGWLAAIVLVSACGRGSTALQQTAVQPVDASTAGDACDAECQLAADCEKRGLGGTRRDACVAFAQKLAKSPECPPYPPPEIMHYDTECPVLAEREPTRQGHLELGVDSTDGATQRAVDAALRPRERPLLDCYSAALRHDSKLSGSVRLALFHDRLGGFSAITSLGSTLPDSHAVDCVMRVVAAQSALPAPPEAVQARVELVFSP